ncbi:non-SMC mitotic condensation complex subunit 1-domain-containing protein [Cantharellus anzutake]|uniref:non-SMC mitotic condensation complex subunit 1-domain-containing protein n=1 Tax=Cantharellus anzutake TaxID=1750568 RepID=UPI001903BD21|nr:non-SMC mitotic condensation complex subunit 1-domain-containing protein [Cantharellus anzutake]KAF8342559.1 non-SMC mitotic condensation complex subunit 1-domain-containing protein [Cantharellus anzutake]
MMHFNLQEEILAIQDQSTYHIPNEITVQGADLNDLRTSLEEVVEAVAESFDAIAQSRVFDVYRSFLKCYDSLSGLFMTKILDSISSGLLASVEAINRELDGTERSGKEIGPVLRSALEMFSFLLQWFAIAAERHSPKEDAETIVTTSRSKGKKTAKSAQRRAAASEQFIWTNHIPSTLSLISRVLRDLQTHRVYTTTAEKDAFINCITRPAWRITESEEHMKSNEIRMSVYKIICHAVKKHGHAFSAQISIMQGLQYFEHLSEPMAGILAVLQKEFDHTQLAEEVLREISQKSFNGQDTKGPRSFSKFLIRLADLSPRIILKQFALLRVHLDSDAYPMRVALVEVIGVLIREIAQDAEDIPSNGDDAIGRSQEGQEKKEKKINKLFELLLERFCDMSSYVRVKVINTLSKLWELRVKLPIQRAQTTPLVIAALSDKASSVRRYAIALLTTMILTHPYGALYGGYLNLKEWEERYRSVKEQLAIIEVKQDKHLNALAGTDKDESQNEGPEANDSGDEEDENEDERGSDDDSHGADQVPKKKKSKARARKSATERALAIEQAEALNTLDMANLTRFRLTKRYIADALQFIREVESAMDIVGQLLGSTSKAEVLEAIEFFKVAYEYQMLGAQVGVKKMLHLIWTKDNSGTTSEEDKELKGIRQRLIECYRALYFDPVDDGDSRQQTNRIAKNMIELTRNSTLAELTSLEELMRTLYEDDKVDQEVLNTLWQVYSTEREIPRFQRRGAIIVLGMFALSKREVVIERTDTLLKIGLGPLGRADLVLAQYTCIALQRIGGNAKKVKGSLEDKTIRLSMDNIMFRKIKETVEHPCTSKDWFGMAEQAINTVYLLGEQPDALCGDLIKSYTRQVFAETRSPSEPNGVPSDLTIPGADASSRGKSAEPAGDAAAPSGDSFLLSQLIFLVGHVAFKHIVYLELVERELKRRKELQAKERGAAAAKGRTSNTKDVDELEQVAGSAEDDTADRITKFCDDEMLYGEKSLLGLFGPMIVHICATPKMYKSPTLRASATLSLSKLMCVSTHFCEDNLMLLFKIMETSKDPIIRSNSIIALGDIAVRFSHLIDENNNKLYDGLSDQSIVVKKNTLMVLTYLILGSMIKVKGQLGEMAKCLEDEDQRIADLARLFFTELSSNKDNAIYNNLPDVISHLSIGQHALEEEAFQRTMRYIFTFIEKEKQAEAIVEKLCQRFRLASEPRQWRDIAFCLSLLPFKSERSVKRLIEGLPFYQDKLHEEAVFNRFNEILIKARSNKSSNKPDTELKEFEQILKDFKEKGEEDQALEESMQKKTAATRKKVSRRKQPTRGRKASAKSATPDNDGSE